MATIRRISRLQRPEDVLEYLDYARDEVRHANVVFATVLDARPGAVRQILSKMRAIRRRLAEANLAILSAEEREAVLTTLEHIEHRAEYHLDPLGIGPIPGPVIANATRSERRHILRQQVRDGRVGRPRDEVDVNRAVELYNSGLSWAEVAVLCFTSRRVIYQRIRELPERPYIRHNDVLPEEELDARLLDIMEEHPFSGTTFVQGALQARGLTIPRTRIRERMQELDPIGNAIRWGRTARRRAYRVRGANYLWHFDANQKLKPWGFDIHGGIDGASRLLLWTEVRPDKRSETVRQIFDCARRIYGWPYKVRADHGTENVGVGAMMIAFWGAVHRPFLQGLSVQNIRIERMWRDVRKDAIERYRILFQDLEARGILNMALRSHRLALYLTFVNRIQRTLDAARHAWNCHRLRTERNRTPVALYEGSRQELINSEIWPGDGEDPHADMATTRGMYDGDLAVAAELLRDYDFERVDGHFGVDVFVGAVQLLQERAPEVDGDIVEYDGI